MANPTPNLDNLKPVRNTEEARKRGRAGGLKAAETKRQRKQARECMEMILSSKVTNEKVKQTLKSMGFKGKDQQNIALLMVSLFQKANLTQSRKHKPRQLTLAYQRQNRLI